MPCHPDRVRKNYEETKVKIKSNYIHPCEMFSTHLFNENRICIMCKKTELEILNRRS